MKILVDTNIFLEILLTQEKKNICKKFLEKNKNNITVSDFSVHSIGLFLYREKRHETFTKFNLDILQSIRILSLHQNKYNDLEVLAKRHNLDFDDVYQSKIALEYDLKIATLDSDFKKIQDKIEIIFL